MAARDLGVTINLEQALMKTIEIEDDLYDYIAAHTQQIGESATSILWRMLGRSKDAGTRKTRAVIHAHELAALLEERTFSSATPAVTRMLRILQDAHAQKGSDFAKVLSVQGRNRTYFAKSKEEILASGESTQPRQIDGTGYWVLTNSPTYQKQQMVRDALKVLNYSESAINAAVHAIQ